MKVLVLGGTRFIGKQVAKQLAAREHRVALFHRHAPPAADGAQHILGDRKRLEWSLEAFRQFAPDVVVDMVAMTEGDANSMVQTFRGIAGRSVVISSMDVYRAYDVLRGIDDGTLEPVPFDEAAPLRTRLYPYRGDTPRAADDPQKWVDEYDKILVEHMAASAPDLPTTILRLPMVYGEGDYQHRVFEYLKRMDDGRPAILLDEDSASWQTSRGYVENVAAAIVRAVEDGRAAGKTYNVADKEVFTEREWVQRIGRAAGWTGQVVALPRAELPAALCFQGNARQSLVGDSSRLRQQLDFDESVDPDEALTRTVAWERANPPEFDPAQFDYAMEDRVLANRAILE
jgi:nucleoside-diphosphate-sugar epimerase